MHVQSITIGGYEYLVNKVATPRINGRPHRQYEVRRVITDDAYHQLADAYVGRYETIEGVLRKRFDGEAA